MKQPPEQNTLKEQMRNIIEEARMILPGLQALFGFQTVAIFNRRFDDLPSMAQAIHLLALAMVVLSIGLVMTPAAWHRMVEPHQVSLRTVQLSSGLICWALLPLALGLALDMFVVLSLVTSNYGASAAGAVATLALLLALWFALPLQARRHSSPG